MEKRILAIWTLQCQPCSVSRTVATKWLWANSHWKHFRNAVKGTSHSQFHTCLRHSPLDFSFSSHPPHLLLFLVILQPLFNLFCRLWSPVQFPQTRLPWSHMCETAIFRSFLCSVLNTATRLTSEWERRHKTWRVVAEREKQAHTL